MWHANFLKTLQIITPFSVTPRWYSRDPVLVSPHFYGWTEYVVKTIPLPAIGLYDYSKTRSKESLAWTILYCLPFLPYRGLWLSKRLMWVNWAASYKILYYTRETLYKAACLAWLAFYLGRTLAGTDLTLLMRMAVGTG